MMLAYGHIPRMQCTLKGRCPVREERCGSIGGVVKTLSFQHQMAVFFMWPGTFLSGGSAG